MIQQEEDEEADVQEFLTTIATLQLQERDQIPKDSSCITIRSLGNKAVPLKALKDTGSLVSLIRESTYKKCYAHKELFRIKNSINLKGINDSPVKILDKIHDQIILESLSSSWFDIEFIVVDDSTMKYDLLIGKKFFIESRLKLSYQNGVYKFHDAMELDEEINYIFAINVMEERTKYDIVTENLNQEITFADRNKLLKTIERADSIEVEKIEDGYCVRIYLKDESLFRCTPRRMSALERKELDEIIDDLLSRKIIQPSVSPYCSHVVLQLVPKRDDRKRMCVDLRPLNQRIFQQKYPFPIIEDQLDKLYNKSIFTKLDMKDGFHQIRIHPDCTKYFAFATPSG